MIMAVGQKTWPLANSGASRWCPALLDSNRTSIRSSNSSLVHCKASSAHLRAAISNATSFDLRKANIKGTVGVNANTVAHETTVVASLQSPAK